MVGFDVVHFFGDPRPLLVQGRPIGRFVVSPVYFPTWLELGPIPRMGGLRSLVAAQTLGRARQLRHPFGLNRLKREIKSRLAAIGEADIIITNSNAEARLLTRDGPDIQSLIRVAHSGVDQRFFSGSSVQGRAMVHQLVGVSDYVLCVARVEPRKNQLSLCHAMRNMGLPLLLVGGVLPGNEPYLAACRKVLPALLHLPHLTKRSSRMSTPRLSVTSYLHGMKLQASPRLRL